MDEIDGFRKTFPLTPYDLFGYLLPGLTFLLSIYMFEMWAQFRLPPGFHKPVVAIMERVVAVTPQGSWFSTFIAVVVILCAVYIAGHVVASTSRLCIDRLFVYKGNGYPYESLLSKKAPDTLYCDEYMKSLNEPTPAAIDALEKLHAMSVEGRIDPTSRPFWQSIFFWFNTLVLVMYLEILFSVYLTCWACLLFTIVSCILGFLLFVMILAKVGASVFIDRAVRNREHFRDEDLRTWRIAAFAYPMQILSRPYLIVRPYIRRTLRREKAFDKAFIQKYEEAFRKVFGFDPATCGTNNYWFCALYVTEHSAVLDSRLSNFHRLYSFSRNLSTALYLAFFYTFLSLALQQSLVANSNLAIRLIPGVLFITAFVLLLNYYSLYVCYYSKFLFRSFVYLTTAKRGAREVTEADTLDW